MSALGRLAAVVVLLGLSGCPVVSPPAAVDAAAPDVIHCTADCECLQYSRACDSDGTCHSVGRPPFGLCPFNPGSSYSCPCVGGACDERGCCVLPDGGIDNGFGPACMPPDAAPTGG